MRLIRAGKNGTRGISRTDVEIVKNRAVRAYARRVLKRATTSGTTLRFTVPKPVGCAIAEITKVGRVRGVVLGTVGRRVRMMRRRR